LADLATAHAELGEALVWFEAESDDEGRASALGGLGIATAPIDADRARLLMLESARLFAVLEDAWGEAIVLGALGWLDTGRGDFAEEVLFERAYALARYVDDEVATAHAATNLAELHLALGRPEEAREVLDVALAAYAAVRLHDGLSYGLEAVAGLASNGGRVEDAARLLGAADRLREEAGVPIWGPRLTKFEAHVAVARSALGDDVFDSRWSEGRLLGFDAALDHARRALRPAEVATP
jgi:tetratricopeptide (TPR) repeat protein